MPGLLSLLVSPAYYALALLMLLAGPLIAFYLIWVVIGVRGYASIFNYKSGESFLFKVDPRLKLLFALVLPALADQLTRVAAFLLLLFMLLTYLWMPDPREKLAFMVPLLLSAILPSAWLDAVSVPPRFFRRLGLGGYLFTLPRYVWSLHVYGFSPVVFYFGLSSGLGVALAIAASFFIVFTTPPSDLLRSLTKSKVPSPLAFSLTVAITAIPMILENIAVTLDVLRSRGVTLRARPTLLSSYYTLKAALLGVANVVILTVKDAQDIAISADLRAFSPSGKRSYYREFKFSLADWVASLIMIGAFTWAVLRG